MVSEQSQSGNDRLTQTRPTSGTGSSGTGAGATAQEAAQNVKETAQDVMQQTKETAGQVVDQAKDQATSQIESRKDQAVESISSVAQALRQAGNHLRQNEQAPVAQYADKAADRVEQFANQLRGKDVQEIMQDVEMYARRQPAVFLGGAFVVGLLAARFLKSTGNRQEDQGTGSNYQGSRSYGGYSSGMGRGYGGYRGGYGYGTGRGGYYGGSYQTSGRQEYYGGEPNLRGRGYAAGTTDYGADRTRYGVDEGRYRGGTVEGTGAGPGAAMGESTGGYGTTDERSWYVRGRETQ